VQVRFYDAANGLAHLHTHKMPISFLEEGGASLHPQGGKFIAVCF
jgi:serine-threonine kinase receptor-associated protein